MGAFIDDDSAVLTGANALDASSEHAARQAMNVIAANNARIFFSLQTIKPNLPLY